LSRQVQAAIRLCFLASIIEEVREQRQARADRPYVAELAQEAAVTETRLRMLDPLEISTSCPPSQQSNGLNISAVALITTLLH